MIPPTHAAARPIHPAVAIITHQEKIERLREEIRVKLDQIEILKAEQAQGEPTADQEIMAVLMRDKP